MRAVCVVPLVVFLVLTGSVGCGSGADVADATDATDAAETTDAVIDVSDVSEQDLYVPVDGKWADALAMDSNSETDTFDLPDGVRVRVGSYNLYGYHWATAKDFGKFIKELNPDLMALVESNPEHLPALAEAAGYPYYCDNGGGRCLLSKTPLSACERVDLVGDRSLLRTETEIGGVTFAVWVVHIDWDIPGNLQAADFMENHFVNEPRSHVIVAGDFNDEHLSRQMNIFGTELGDAFTAYGWYPGQRITWPAQYFDDTEGSQTIDLIYSRKSMRPIVLEADAVNLSPCLSDHKPVWADLLFPGDETPYPDWMTTNRLDPMRVFGDDLENPLPNLVRNPGAEDGLDGWVVTGGGVSTEARFGCRPSTGEKFFCGFDPGYSPDDGYSRFTQEISLVEYAPQIDAGTAWLNVSGEMITCPYLLTEGDITTNRVERYDDAEMTVTFISSSGVRFDRRVSKRRDTLMWYPFADVIPIPRDTRSVEIALTAYKRIDFVGGIDSGFDNIHVSVRELPIHGMVGGNLLRFGMDETSVLDLEDNTIANSGWIVRTTGTPIGLNWFPPVSFSGLGYLFAGNEVSLEPLDEPAVVSQFIDMTPYIQEIDDSNMKIRWGGWSRSNTAEGAMITMALQLLDGRGDVWAEVPGRTVWESEWIYQENTTRIPQGIRAVRFVMTADIPVFTGFLGVEGMESQDDVAFADELFVRPELAIPVLPEDHQ